MKKTITIKRSDLDLFTVHDVLAAIEKIVDLNDEQKFRITAIVKRHDHYEKHDMYQKFQSWSKFHTQGFIQELLIAKILTHAEYKKAPDEEIVTWDVGSHKYSQKPPTKEGEC